VDASIGQLRQISAGDQHSCAVTTTRVAWCWGRSFQGEVGSGFSGVFYQPLRVNSGSTRFLGVSPGGGHSCGVASDNAAWCWGANGLGQLGVTGGANRLSPVGVSGGLELEAIHAGLAHTCALDLEGHAWCWGSNAQGQLGNGNRPTGSAFPVRVGGS
jgi:alpha-tubulin suppressor-like RCC1 family protein